MRQSSALLVIHERRLARSLAVEKAARSLLVEPQDPVSHDLKRHPADLGRLAARGAVINCCEGEKPTCLRPILQAPGERTKPRCVKILPQSNRYPAMANLLVFANGNQTMRDSGIPRESHTARVGIRRGSPLVNDVLKTTVSQQRAKARVRYCSENGRFSESERPLAHSLDLACPPAA